MSDTNGLDFDETIAALWLASYAEDFLNEFAAGKVTGETLVNLGHAVKDLKMKLVGGRYFADRAEELDQAMRETFKVEGQ